MPQIEPAAPAVLSGEELRKIDAYWRAATLRELGEGPLPAAPPPALWDACAEWGRRSGQAHLRVRAGAASAVERASGLPCRHSCRHSSSRSLSNL